MRTLIKELCIYLLSICSGLFLLRWGSDYLSSLLLADYLAYSAIAIFVIAFVSHDKDDTLNRDLLSLITQRELVSRNHKIGNEVLRSSITVNLSITAILLLLVSFVLVMLDSGSTT